MRLERRLAIGLAVAVWACAPRQEGLPVQSVSLAPIAPEPAPPRVMARPPDTSKPRALQWLTSEADARRLAASEHRPLIVTFDAAWCAACVEMERLTFADASVRAEAGRFVAVRVDVTDDEDASVVALRAKYGVIGLPTVIVLDNGGTERVRINEFVHPDRFLEAIRRVE